MADEKHCGGCRYLGWLKLARWCRHPDHPAPLKKWPGRCKDWLDIEFKNMPGKTAPEPVELEEAA